MQTKTKRQPKLPATERIEIQAVWSSILSLKNPPVVPFPAYRTAVPGLVIHRDMLCPASFRIGQPETYVPEEGETWSLTHEASGWLLCNNIKTAKLALALAEAVRDVADWTLERTPLLATPNLVNGFMAARREVLEK